MEKVQGGEIDVVIVKDLSRIGRHNGRVLVLIDEFKNDRHIINKTIYSFKKHKKSHEISIKYKPLEKKKKFLKYISY